uniref:Ovule protein n=1 Tax=Strongyloides papillosus TaxID=174720 RepID=A0A0N5BBU9_STREA
MEHLPYLWCYCCKKDIPFIHSDNINQEQKSSIHIYQEATSMDDTYVHGSEKIFISLIVRILQIYIQK